MFQLSDVYGCPSVSEPFGISPLEVMRSNVPLAHHLKQSGVAEVLDYAVKVDYWDVDALADAIYGLINNNTPPSRTCSLRRDSRRSSRTSQVERRCGKDCTHLRGRDRRE